MPVSRPHLLICDTPAPCARDLAALRESFQKGETSALLQAVLDSALAYLDAPLITPFSKLPNRAATHVRHANRDYAVVATASHRVTTCALASLITQEQRYVDAAMAQVDCLFDPVIWPDWRDKAHPWQPADLRTGMLAYELGLAYDWLHIMLTPQQRQAYVKGMDERAIQPYFQSIANGATWSKPDRQDNWVTCIVGGLGVLGMALADDHPESARLVQLATECMNRYLCIYGPEGEFNESPAYAASSRKVAGFFLLQQCHDTQGRFTNAATWDILAKHCRWLMYMTLPPGRIACFGDAHHHSKPAAELFAAVAAATRDPVLQWFFNTHYSIKDSTRIEPELPLWIDQSIKPVSPQDSYPLGKHFPAHGGTVCSRTDWDPYAAACVVTAKAGSHHEHHGHHDAGEVCIDAHGRALIVDLDKPELYPADYTSNHGRNYYNVSEFGHNLLLIDQQHRLHDKQLAAHYRYARFDDARGGEWSFDLTAFHENVTTVTRDVIHLLPGVVAVLDQVQCEDEQPHCFDLKWHTSQPAELEMDGSFVVNNGQARLMAKVVKLGGDDSPLVHRCGEQAYAPPFDRNRLGDLLPQKHEPFVQSSATQAGGVAILSLFATAGQGQTLTPWHKTQEDEWYCQAGGKTQCVQVINQGRLWRLAKL